MTNKEKSLLSSNNHKFPVFSYPEKIKSNRYWHWGDEGTLSEFDWETHDNDIEDWFKRCMEDHPKLMDCPPKIRDRPGGAYEWYGLGVLGWYEEWFSQFKEES